MYFMRAMIFVVIMLLSACSTVTDFHTLPVSEVSKEDVRWQQHLAQLQSITAYQAKGQIGFVGEKQRFSSLFEWHYDDETHFSLKLYSHLSRKMLLLERNVQSVRLSDETGRTRSTTEADQLIKTLLGVNIPLDQLAHWLKGEPRTQIDYQLNAQALLNSFLATVEGDLWQVRYVSYHQGVVPLPKEIRLQNGEKRLRIQINQWTL